MTLIERLLAQANKEANELSDLLNEAAQALAQPQQEPVAVYQVKQSIGESVWCDVSKAEFDASVYFGVTKRAVYTSPPARKPLTREQVKTIMAPDYSTATMQERADFMVGFRAAEAAHGIKEAL